MHCCTVSSCVVLCCRVLSCYVGVIDCRFLPACRRLRRPYRGSMQCINDTSEDLLTCTVECPAGYDFAGQMSKRYSCGRNTSYLWPHESPDNPRCVLPACTSEYTPTVTTLVLAKHIYIPVRACVRAHVDAWYVCSCSFLSSDVLPFTLPILVNALFKFTQTTGSCPSIGYVIPFNCSLSAGMTEAILKRYDFRSSLQVTCRADDDEARLKRDISQQAVSLTSHLSCIRDGSCKLDTPTVTGCHQRARREASGDNYDGLSYVEFEVSITRDSPSTTGVHYNNCDQYGQRFHMTNLRNKYLFCLHAKCIN